MDLPNPTRRIRNAILRFRELSDGVRAVQGSMGAADASLRAAEEALRSIQHETARTSDELHRVEDRVADLQETAAQMEALLARVARRLAFAGSRTRVVFLVHNAATWDSYDELVRLMHRSEDFEPVVLTIPHRFGGPDRPAGEEDTHRALNARGIPHLRVREDQLADAAQILDALDPGIVFRQSQWDADIPEAFGVDALRPYRLCLVPYETVNPTHNVPWGDPPVNSAVDQPFHRAAWRVYIANETALDIAKEDSILGATQFRAVGHPKADALRAATASWPDMSPEGGPRPNRILWSAHHSILSGWNDFGMLPVVAADMLAWAEEAADTQFVFMHHPLLPATLQREEHPQFGWADFTAWLEAWERLPNTRYWTDAEYAPVLRAADVLVTDGPSMITEAQVVGTPAVFLERADHIPFNDVGARLMRGVHAVPDVDAARRTTAQILTEGDPLSAQQRENSAALFGTPGAAHRILEDLRQGIAEEAGTRTA